MNKKDRAIHCGWLSLMVIGSTGELILCLQAIIEYKFLTAIICFGALSCCLWLCWWGLGMSMKLWRW